MIVAPLLPPTCLNSPDAVSLEAIPSAAIPGNDVDHLSSATPTLQKESRFAKAVKALFAFLKFVLCLGCFRSNKKSNDLVAVSSSIDNEKAELLAQLVLLKQAFKDRRDAEEGDKHAALKTWWASAFLRLPEKVRDRIYMEDVIILARHELREAWKRTLSQLKSDQSTDPIILKEHGMKLEHGEAIPLEESVMQATRQKMEDEKWRTDPAKYVLELIQMDETDPSPWKQVPFYLGQVIEKLAAEM